MKLSSLVSLAESLGLKINWLKAASLVPLLDKKSSEVEDADIVSVLNALGLPASNTLLISEAALAIKTSDFNTVADMLGEEEYLVPLVSQFVSVGSREKTVKETHENARLKCLVCEEGVIEFKFDDIAPLDTADSHVGVCKSCSWPSRYSVGQIKSYWS